MQFDFPIRSVLRQPIVGISRKYLDDLPTYALPELLPKITDIVDRLGIASQQAQKLPVPITSLAKLTAAREEQSIYVLSSEDTVDGLLKVGRRKLFIHTEDKQMREITPLCVLDFYISEQKQRSGCGKRLFAHMLQAERVQPHELGYDRPSDKFRAFLHRHYGLQHYTPQVNNFVVFREYFTGVAPRLPEPPPPVAAAETGGSLSGSSSSSGNQQRMSRKAAARDRPKSAKAPRAMPSGPSPSAAAAGDYQPQQQQQHYHNGVEYGNGSGDEGAEGGASSMSPQASFVASAASAPTTAGGSAQPAAGSGLLPPSPRSLLAPLSSPPAPPPAAAAAAVLPSPTQPPATQLPPVVPSAASSSSALSKQYSSSASHGNNSAGASPDEERTGGLPDSPRRSGAGRVASEPRASRSLQQQQPDSPRGGPAGNSNSSGASSSSRAAAAAAAAPRKPSPRRRPPPGAAPSATAGERREPPSAADSPLAAVLEAVSSHRWDDVLGWLLDHRHAAAAAAASHVNHHQDSFLHAAIRDDAPIEVVSRLCEINPELVERRNADHLLPLDLAQLCGRSDVEKFLQSPDILRLQISHAVHHDDASSSSSAAHSFSQPPSPARPAAPADYLQPQHHIAAAATVSSSPAGAAVAGRSRVAGASSVSAVSGAAGPLLPSEREEQQLQRLEQSLRLSLDASLSLTRHLCAHLSDTEPGLVLLPSGQLRLAWRRAPVSVTVGPGGTVEVDDLCEPTDSVREQLRPHDDIAGAARHFETLVRRLLSSYT